MLIKKTDGTRRGTRLATPPASPATGSIIDRRSFLRRSGIAAGGLGAVMATGGGMTTKAQAAPAAPAKDAKSVKTVCTH